MEREIKFRFWTGSQMESWDHAKAWSGLGHYMENHREYIPMQYTGLKDKNAKEIYEGDILEAEYKGSSVGKYKNVVVWEPSEHGFGFANSPLWTFDNIEIIGNIYETPEILKS